MKNFFLWVVLLVPVLGIKGQIDSDLFKGLSIEQTTQFIAQGYVLYSDFGAVGDGKTDDIEAIAKTHAFANKYSIQVKANENAKYYIGRMDCTAFIQTDTNFGSATFIIDDRDLKNSKASVFEVTSKLTSFKLSNITALKKNQEKLDVLLPTSCLITVSNKRKKQYVRFGLNQNDGSGQMDIFRVDKQGVVDMESPIIWDFDFITEISASPIDDSIITITGGRFVTIANKEKSEYNYFNRNILINRSNVIVDGLEHRIEGEGLHGAPYRGFVSIVNAYKVVVKNTKLTGHKKYATIGAKGKPVSMGSYDISVNSSLNVSFVNCSQTNDISDSKYWGIMASNFSKNLLFDYCKLSRFDAHMGVYNATIRNSTLGYMGINAIGSGTFTVENSTIKAKHLINLRQDYGSTWQGKFIIRNCIFIPFGEKNMEIWLINGFNSGQHDFGYTCYMPESIIIENLYIDDSCCKENNKGPFVFADFNDKMDTKLYTEKYPYIKSKQLLLNDISSHSGKILIISKNKFMFENLGIQGNTKYSLF